MTVYRPLAVALCAAVFSTLAAAQLKLPPNMLSGPSRPAAAAAPPMNPAPVTEPAPLSETAKKELAGELAAGGWLTLLDRRNWGTAWETTAQVFRNAVPLPSWMDNIPKVRDPLGVLVQRVPLESAYRTQLAGRPDGEYVTAIFASTFDKNPDTPTQEVVTVVLEADGKWRVTGYSTR